MTTTAILGIGGALALTVAVQLGAQEKPPQPITITGCLQRAAAQRGRGAKATIGTTGTEQFVLTRIAPPNSRSAGSNSESTQGSASKKSAGDGRWFVVTGDASTLRTDVDRRVEITGTIDTTGSVVGTSASVTDGPSGEIHATSLKVINASCAK
jgi:hypothetical protein